MKAKINVGFSSKMQAASYTPVESVNSMEIEIEYKDDEDLKTQISKYHKLLRSETIKHTIEGAREFLEKVAKE
jgi:ribosome-binding ATPase YchF (GTP1/OBG family)